MKLSYEGLGARFAAVTARFSPCRSLEDRWLANLHELLDEHPVVTVNEFEGRFRMDCRSDLFRRLLRNGSYEPELACIGRNHLDVARDAIDIGANIGFYTVLMARRLQGRRVLAIEPVPGALKHLYGNLELNRVSDRTVVFEGVASGETGRAQLHFVPGKEEYSSMGAMVHPNIAGSAFESVDVTTSTIDNLVAKHGLDPGFIKMDVEGMEHAVLAGMDAVLSNNRPVVLSELCEPLLRQNGSRAAEILALFRRYEYEVMDPLVQGGIPGKRRFGDILCLPRENATGLTTPAIRRSTSRQIG